MWRGVTAVKMCDSPQGSVNVIQKVCLFDGEV